MKKILWLRERIKEQKTWIDSCGGDLSGYIANYGDPNIPPLNKDGTPKIIVVLIDKQYLFPNLTRVPNTTDQFYYPHAGNGGSKIYEADHNRLLNWENELNSC